MSHFIIYNIILYMFYAYIKDLYEIYVYTYIYNMYDREYNIQGV